MVQAPVTRTAEHSIARAPRRSRSGPISGDSTAAIKPPSDTAPESAVRDQPKSPVIGVTNTESVATAGPWRAKPAQHTQARTIQP
jgi:hypothetical protein